MVPQAPNGATGRCLGRLKVRSKLGLRGSRRTGLGCVGLHRYVRRPVRGRSYRQGLIQQIEPDRPLDVPTSGRRRFLRQRWRRSDYHDGFRTNSNRRRTILHRFRGDENRIGDGIRTKISRRRTSLHGVRTDSGRVSDGIWARWSGRGTNVDRSRMSADWALTSVDRVRIGVGGSSSPVPGPDGLPQLMQTLFGGRFVANERKIAGMRKGLGVGRPTVPIRGQIDLSRFVAHRAPRLWSQSDSVWLSPDRSGRSRSCPPTVPDIVVNVVAGESPTFRVT
jgi:hypothetical protein